MKRWRTQIFDLSPGRVEDLERLWPFFLTFHFLSFTSFCRWLKPRQVCSVTCVETSLASTFSFRNTDHVSTP